MTITESVQIMRDTYAWKKTERIPTFSNYWTYMILDAGETLSRALYDYDVLYKCVTRFHEKYRFDCYNYTGARNPLRVVEALGGDHYIVDDAREAFNVKDRNLMEADEYDELIANPLKFLWEKAIPRVCPKAKDENAGEYYAKAIAEQEKYNAFVAKVSKKFMGEYGVTTRSMAGLYTGGNFLFNTLRGIKGLSIDMRKDINKVIAACEAMMESFLDLKGTLAKCTKEMPDQHAGGMGTALLSHSVMSHKQFELIEWPYLKKMMDRCVETGHPAVIFSEAYFYRFADFFQEYPKGYLSVQPEQDDVFELRKMLPNAVINGGMPSTTLGKKTKEDCIEYAKKLVNEVGRDGGFIMGQDKMMSYRNDAKPENILAVQEFCRTYRG